MNSSIQEEGGLPADGRFSIFPSISQLAETSQINANFVAAAITPDFSNFKFPDIDPSMAVEEPATEHTEKVADRIMLDDVERNAIFYRISDESSSVASSQQTHLNDEFFELTVEDAKRMQRDLKQQV